MNQTMNQPTTIGVLYPGEMGAALGRVLVAAGHRVLSTAVGRSMRSEQLAQAAGIELVGSLPDVLARADVILSCVPSTAALPLARQVVDMLGHGRDAIYVDVNSVSPRIAQEVAEIVSSHGLRFVDASIHGQAARLTTQGVLYLSGHEAGYVASLLAGCFRVHIVGDEVGQASLIKMLMSGVSKGMSALFLEMSLAAREAGLLDEFLQESGAFYPGLIEPVSRMLPTYARHAARRAEEMRELEQTLFDLELEPRVVAGVSQLISALAETDLIEPVSAVPMKLREFIDVVALDHPSLRREPAAISS